MIPNSLLGYLNKHGYSNRIYFHLLFSTQPSCHWWRRSQPGPNILLKEQIFLFFSFLFAAWSTHKFFGARVIRSLKGEILIPLHLKSFDENDNMGLVYISVVQLHFNPNLIPSGWYNKVQVVLVIGFGSTYFHLVFSVWCYSCTGMKKKQIQQREKQE